MDKKRGGSNEKILTFKECSDMGLFPLSFVCKRKDKGNKVKKAC